MKTRLMVRPNLDMYVNEYYISNDGFLQFTTNGILEVGMVVVITSLSYPTIITDITDFDGSKYTTATLWIDPELPPGGSIINYLKYTFPNGTPDPTFVTNNSLPSSVFACSEVNTSSTDKSYLVGGDFTSYRGSSAIRMVRINQDGTRNTTFSVGVLGFNSTVTSISAESNGSSYAVGNFTTYQGVSRRGIVKLDETGAYDTGFVIGTGFSAGSVNWNLMNHVIGSPSGPYCFGSFTQYNGSSKNCIVKLLTDGTVDPAFNVGTGFAGGTFGPVIIRAEVDSLGRVIACGDFTSYRGTPRNNLVRIDSDGTIDTTFTIGSGFNGVVHCVTQVSGGKYMVGGQFTTYDGVSTSRICRLNSDGSLDASFSCLLGSGTDAVLAISETSDGKYVVSGEFGNVNGEVANGLLRLESNGDIDGTFNLPSDLNNGGSPCGVWNIIDSRERIVLFGEFTSYRGQPVDKIIRLDQRLFSVRFSPVELDLTEELQFPLSFNIADITKPQNRKANYSKNISLPGSDKNSQILAQLFEIDVDSTFNVNRKCEAFVIQDGVEIFRGSLKLNSVFRADWNTVSYDVSLNGEISDIFSAMKNEDGSDLYLSDLDLSEYAHAYNRQAIIDSWNGLITKDGAPYNNIQEIGPWPVSDTGFYTGNKTVFIIGATAAANIQVGDTVRFIMDNPGDPLVNFDASQGDHTVIGFDGNGDPIVNLEFQAGATNSGQLSLMLATGEGYVYPSISYGTLGSVANYANFPPGVKISWKPFIYAKTYFDKIFEHIGYTYESEFLNSQLFKRLITNNTSDLSGDVTASMAPFGLTGGGATQILPFDTVISNPSGQWDPINFIYTNGPEPDAPTIELSLEIDDLGNFEQVSLLVYRSLNNDGTPNAGFAGGTGNNQDNAGNVMKYVLVSAGGLSPWAQWITPNTKARIDLIINFLTLSPGEQIRFVLMNELSPIVLTNNRVTARQNVDEQFPAILNSSVDYPIIGTIDQSYDPGNNMVVPYARYSVPFDMTLESYVSADFTVPGDSFVKVLVYNYTTSTVIYDPPSYLTPGGDTSISPPLSVSAGDEIGLILRIDNVGPIVANITALLMALEWNPISVVSTIGPEITATFGLLKIISSGNTSIEQMTAKDFVMSIVNAFNLYIEPSQTTERKVNIEPFSNYYTGGFVDWTDKVDISQDVEIEPTGANVPKKYRFTYSDDGDFYNVDYKNNYGKTYGEHTESVENDFSEASAETKIKFAPTPLVDVTGSDTVPQNGALIIPRIAKDDSGTPMSQIKHRLLYWTGIRRSAEDFVVGPGVTSNPLTQSTINDYGLAMYGYAGHMDNPITPTFDLNFGVCDGYYFGLTYPVTVPTQTLYAKYWEPQIIELTSPESRLVRFWMKLSAFDIATLSFQRIYLINGVMYRLQKINDYNPLTGAPVKCEFLKAKFTGSISS